VTVWVLLSELFLLQYRTIESRDSQNEVEAGTSLVRSKCTGCWQVLGIGQRGFWVQYWQPGVDAVITVPCTQNPDRSLELAFSIFNNTVWTHRLPLRSSGRHIFWEVVGLERGPLSLVSTTEELLERKSSDFGLENRDYGRSRSVALTTRHPSILKSWH
jgi:hypothetical protein